MDTTIPFYLANPNIPVVAPAPTIASVNSGDTSSVVTQDNSLNSDGADTSSDGTNFSDVLQSLVQVAPSLLLLSKTPTTQLPRVTGGTAQTPQLAQPQISQTSNQIFILFLFLIIAVVAIIILRK